MEAFRYEHNGNTAIADKESSIRQRLEAAKVAYTVELKELNEKVVEDLDQAAEDARKDGQKSVLDQATVEKKAFLEKGDLPTIVPISSFLKGRTKAAFHLDSAYELAIQKFTKAGMDEFANAIQKERVVYIEKLNDEKRRLFERFRRLYLAGSVWRFGEAGGPPFATLKLLPNGKIGGSRHPNETLWRLEGNRLVFARPDQAASTAFDNVQGGQRSIATLGAPSPEQHAADVHDLRNH